eukprot:scaffold311660_cov96-Cyclotella_meneghiniana.AAC.1
MVFKKLQPTTNVLPKAQSFAAEVRADNNYLELLIGGGYGYTGETLEEDPQFTHSITQQAYMNPRPSNKGSPACKFCDSVRESSSQYHFIYDPCSPN